MKFTFDPNLKFKCKKCGQCCDQYSFTISENELNFIRQKIDEKEYSTEPYPEKFYLPYEIKFTSDFCPFYKDKLCSVYKNRFSTCRIYPFDFIVTPDKEYIIDLVKCSGVSKNEGEEINETYINQLFNDINKYDPNFIKNKTKFLHLKIENLIPGYTGYDQVDFNTKMNIKRQLIALIKEKDILIESSEVITRALELSLNEDFFKIEQLYFNKLKFIPTNLAPFCYLSEGEANSLWRDYLKKHRKEIIAKINYSKKEKIEIIEKIIKRGHINVMEGKNIVQKNINENTVFRRINGELIDVKIKDTLIDIPYGDNSIQLMNEYLCEIINRNGISGFFIIYPLLHFLSGCKNLMWELYNQGKVIAFIHKHKQIEETDMEEAIKIVDSHSLITPIMRQIIP